MALTGRPKDHGNEHPTIELLEFRAFTASRTLKTKHWSIHWATMWIWIILQKIKPLNATFMSTTAQKKR